MYYINLIQSLDLFQKKPNQFSLELKQCELNCSLKFLSLESSGNCPSCWQIKGKGQTSRARGSLIRVPGSPELTQSLTAIVSLAGPDR